MEYEQNYSELLREQPIAGVKVILDWANIKVNDAHSELSWNERDNEKLRIKKQYWQQVATDCKQELELRIKKIFP